MLFKFFGNTTLLNWVQEWKQLSGILRHFEPASNFTVFRAVQFL